MKEFYHFSRIIRSIENNRPQQLKDLIHSYHVIENGSLFINACDGHWIASVHEQTLYHLETDLTRLLDFELLRDLIRVHILIDNHEYINRCAGESATINCVYAKMNGV